MDEERLAAIEDAIGQLAEVIGQIAEKVDWHDKQLDDSNSESLAAQLKAVTDDFGSMIGGFNGILADRKKARYANMVGSHAGLQAYAPRYAKTFKSDLVGDAVESILAFLQQEGASEEGIPGVLDQIVSELKARLDEEQAEGTPAEEASESPAIEGAEHVPGGSESGPEGMPPKAKALEIEVKTGGELPPDLAAEARRFRGQRPA
jgi:hypothetical protein